MEVRASLWMHCLLPGILMCVFCCFFPPSSRFIQLHFLIFCIKSLPPGRGVCGEQWVPVCLVRWRMLFRPHLIFVVDQIKVFVPHWVTFVPHWVVRRSNVQMFDWNANNNKNLHEKDKTGLGLSLNVVWIPPILCARWITKNHCLEVYKEFENTNIALNMGERMQCTCTSER